MPIGCGSNICVAPTREETPSGVDSLVPYGEAARFALALYDVKGLINLADNSCRAAERVRSRANGMQMLGAAGIGSVIRWVGPRLLGSPAQQRNAKMRDLRTLH